MNTLLEINDFVLCLGVGKASGVLNAHLFRLKDPINLITRPWQTGEEFTTGKWYKVNKTKKYEQIEDVVRTTVIQKMNLMGNSQKTMLELILPVFFPPDLSSLKQFGQVPVLPNRNALSIPICPLFGPENVEYLPPVSWDKEQICMYSDQLYGLKINLSYRIGSSPQWTHLISRQLKPWYYEEYGIVKQLCMESREEGLLLDGICPVHFMKNSPKICFMLNKQAELAIAICSDTAKKKGSEFREFWPIRLPIYESPIIIALDCPQSKQSFKNDLIVRKLASTNLQFEIVYNGKEDMLGNLMHFPFLGSITDQFAYLLDAQVKKETFTTMQATMVFSLEKRSVAWVVVGIKDQSTPKMAENDLLNGEMEDKWHLLKNIRELEEPRMDKKLVASSSKLNTVTPNSIAPRKFAIAVFMTIRSDGDAVFLFWSSKAKVFYEMCYAKFHSSLNFNEKFGKWFELKFLDNPYSSHKIIVFDFKETKEYVVTRVRDGLCAQFYIPKRHVPVWHKIYPCEVTVINSNNFVLDNGWWPWLCRKCYPSLRELNEEQKVEEDTKNFLVDMAKRMYQSLALEEEGNSTIFKEKPSESTTGGNGMAKKEHIPIIQKQPANPKSADGPTTTVLAVLFSVRDTNREAVFLIYDEYKNAFTHRIYADPPEMIVGSPSIGRWYWLKYNSNITLQDGLNIEIITVQNLIGKPPIETRVKYDVMAQFNSRQFYILTWHGTKLHDRSIAKVSSDAPWWPNICFYCYSNVNANNVEAPKVVVKKEEAKNSVVNSAKWATGANSVPVANKSTKKEEKN